MCNFTKRLLLLLLLMAPMLTMSQVLVSQFALDAGVDSTKWVALPADTATTRTLIVNGGDGRASLLTDIGFEFAFGGTTYTQFSVNTDGNLKFGSPATGTGGYSTPFGYNLNYNLPKINGMGCDGKMSGDGYVKCALMGTAPSRVLVVEFKTAKYSGSASTSDVMWQVHLFEGTNEVQLVYGSEAPMNAPSQFQIGMAASVTDVVTVNPTTSTLLVGMNETSYSDWPDPNTYYRFYLPTCIRPSGLELLGLTADSVSFEWSTGLGQTSWQYTCVEVGGEPNWESVMTVNDTVGSIVNLEPNTDYLLYLRTNCGVEGFSDPTSLEFHTGCVSLDVPYFEGFEDYGDRAFPNCWNSIKGTTMIQQNTEWTRYSYAGNNAVKIGTADTLVAPRVRLTANEMMLIVQVKLTDPEAGTLDVGYTTNAAGTDFTTVMTIAPVHNEYQEYVVDYSSLGITDTVYVAFRHNEGVIDYYNFYIDDAEIMRVSSCPRISHAYVRNITHNGATVAWTANDEVMSYDVAYGLTDTLEHATRVNVLVGEDSLALVGLLSDTTYYVWVRNVCAEDSSMWYRVGAFETKAECAKVLDVYVSSVSRTSAAVCWTLDESYGETISSVMVSYKRSSDSVWSTPVSATGYYILQNLAGGYRYDVKVQAMCDEVGAEEVVVSFSTLSCGVELAGNKSMTNNNLPFAGYYRYGYSQMLYPASSLTGVDTIIGLEFDIQTNSVPHDRVFDVYMANVDQETLTVMTPINMNGVTKVATDVSVSTAPGKAALTFDSAFVYDGVSNLVVIMDDHTGFWKQHIYVYTNTLGSSLYKRSDNVVFTEGDTVVSGLQMMSGTPDITFLTLCPELTCDVPVVAFDGITSNSVKINWQAGGSETQWLVEYKVADSTEWISATVDVSTYTFTDLLSGTLYDIRVGALCGGDTLYTDVQAFTDCMSYTLPFVENFDDAVLTCWTFGSIGDGVLGWIEDGGMLDYGYDGGGYLITPMLSAELSEAQVSFQMEARSFYYGGALVVSVGTDPNNYGSFVPVDTVVVSAGSPMGLQLVSLASYGGTGQYVMFSSFTGQLCIDSIRIELIPECSMPTDLVMSNITHNSATVSWTDNGASVEKWEVYWQQYGSSVWMMDEVLYEDGASYGMTGLMANTEYNVSVATICTTGDTNVTLYPIVFRTACDVVTLPYFEDFEGIALGDYHYCWYRDTPEMLINYDLGYDPIRVPAAYTGEGNSVTMVLSKNKAMVSPLIPIPINRLSVNFDMKVHDTTYAGDLVVGFTTNPNDLSTITVVDTLDIDTNSWNNYTINFNTLTSVDTGYVVFKNVNNQADGSNWSLFYYFIWLDNVYFSEYSSCERPTNVRISNVAATTAQMTFEDGANTNNYTVAWNTVRDLNSAMTMTTTTTTVQLSNLQSGTTYYAWVRSDCSDTSHSAWVYAEPFKTECVALEVPYVEDFNSYSYGVGLGEMLPMEYPHHTIPDCWKVWGQDPTGYEGSVMITNFSSYGVSGNSLYVGSSSWEYLFMVLPKVSVPIDSLMLTFSYRLRYLHSQEDEFVLGVMTDNRDTSTFIKLENIDQEVSFTTFSHAFALDEELDANTDYYIALRFGGVGTYQNMGIDDVMITYAPTCLQPIELELNQVGITTANVSWNGNSPNYQLDYRIADSTIGWTSAMFATNAGSLSNLVGGTVYEMRVRGVCGAGDSSAWSDVVRFTTLCTAYDVPWSEDFDGYVTDVSSDHSRPLTYPNHKMPDCWVFPPMTVGSYGGPAAWLTAQPNTSWTSYNSIEGISLRMVSDAMKPMYAVLPAMNARIDTLVMTFDYAMADYASPLSLGVVTDPHDFSTFIELERFPVFDSAHSAEHYFLFDDLDTTETYYITFYAGRASNYNTAIDNISIDYMPSCIRPGGVRAYSVMHDAANIKWHSNATSAEVSYRLADTEQWTTVVQNVDTIALTGLSASSSYEVVVRSICGVGDTSASSDTLTFTTECNPMGLPFIQNFTTIDGMSDLTCWSFCTGLVDDAITGRAPIQKVTPSMSNWKFVSSTDALNGPHIYINIYGTSRQDWLMTPLLSITRGSILTFDVAFVDYYDEIAATDFEDDKFYVMATTDNGTTWTKLLTWSSDSTDTYPLDSLTITGDSMSVSLEQFSGQNIRIAFYGESTEYGGDNNLHVGNIKVESFGPECNEPMDVAVTPEAVSATLTWSGDSLNYEVAIRMGDTTMWSDSIAVTDSTYTFTGLMPEVTYEYRVRQVCDVDLFSEWVGGTFTTLPLPCEKPVVAIEDITGVGATFTWAAGENHSVWEVNVFNNMINDMYDVTAPTHMVDNLEHALDYYVAVRAKCAENVYSEWSDTVVFTTLDCYPVTGVVASDITKNSAVITWTPGGDEPEWIINYGEYGFSQGQGVFDTISSTIYTITGLEPESDYDVYVRAVCGEDFISTWSTPVCQFQTLVDDDEGIDGIEGDYRLVIYPNPTSGATTINLSGIDGEVTISLVDMNGRVISTETMVCGSDCQKTMDVEGLAQGSYFVRVVGDEINSVRKLIVR